MFFLIFTTIEYILSSLWSQHLNKRMSYGDSSPPPPFCRFKTPMPYLLSYLHDHVTFRWGGRHPEISLADKGAATTAAAGSLAGGGGEGEVHFRTGTACESCPGSRSLPYRPDLRGGMGWSERPPRYGPGRGESVTERIQFYTGCINRMEGKK
jgi:hypothetical protein